MGAYRDHLVSWANSLIDYMIIYIHVFFLLEADDFIPKIKELTPLTFPLAQKDRRAKSH